MNKENKENEGNIRRAGVNIEDYTNEVKQPAIKDSDRSKSLFFTILALVFHPFVIVWFVCNDTTCTFVLIFWSIIISLAIIYGIKARNTRIGHAALILSIIITISTLIIMAIWLAGSPYM